MSKHATVVTTKGGTVTLSEEALGGLNVRGKIVFPDDESYEEARVIWNTMIDRKPGMIVECMGSADVVACVKFAGQHALKVSVRGAGHNIAGKSLADGAMCIDLSKWRSLNVDPTRKIANISPGATLGDIDHETKEYGLVLPVGVNSTTGIGGLTLGGGFGWLCRKYGMTLDSLLSADVVMADGGIIHCDETSEPDLFWGLRGGGGNFGIVTNFEFQLHEVGPMVTAGPLVFTVEDAKQVLQGINESYPTSPDELTCWGVFRQAPPFPFVSEEYHFKPVFIVACCWCGKPEDAKAEIDKLRALGKVIGDGVGEVPFATWQQAFDGLLTPGFRNYWKTNNFMELSDGMIDSLCASGANVPNFGAEIFIAGLGGAVNRVPKDKTAYAQRDINFIVNCHTRWEDPEEDDFNKNFARDLFDSLLPFSAGTAYSNFVSDGDEKPEEQYGPALAKLAAVKTKYDPNNFFSVNYNVTPTTQSQ